MTLHLFQTKRQPFDLAAKGREEAIKVAFVFAGAER